ncbi:MAG: hypothetical protein HXS47_00180, partial [Theionarchaea archaeon]|nr:hypothetical protein [Theionarchaea archaeon]
MEIDAVNAISEYLDNTNFFDDEKKLETMYYLMRGKTYREIAGIIGKQISFVQRVMDFIRNYKLLYYGRWSPNVYKIGMKKRIVFLPLKEWKIPKSTKEIKEIKNFDFITYIHLVHAEVPKVLFIYTYPDNCESEIVSDISNSEEISPFYYS